MRYDPKFEVQRSQYPVNNLNEGNLSRVVVAFDIAPYANEVPKLMRKLSNMSIEKRSCEKKSRLVKRIEHGKDVFCLKERK